jgi:hypothetical protein
MPDINKPPSKILDICLIIKYNLYKKKKPKWSKKLDPDKLILKICLINLLKKAKKTKKNLSNSNNLILKFKFLKNKLKLLNNKSKKIKANYLSLKLKFLQLLIVNKMSKLSVKDWKN